jgi:hypothetical protein
MTSPARSSATPVSVPWPVAELIRVYAVNAASTVALLAAWWASSGTVRNSTQVMALAVAVTALVVSGSGNAVWLMVGRRAVGMRRAALRSRLEELVGSLDAQAPLPYPEPVAAADDAGPLLTLRNGTRYHRPGCELVTGKATVAWSADSRSDRKPCGVCLP